MLGTLFPRRSRHDHRHASFGVLRRARSSGLHQAAVLSASRAFVEVVRNTFSWFRSTSSSSRCPLAGIRLNPTITAILALGLNGGAYAIEIIRGGV